MQIGPYYVLAPQAYPHNQRTVTRILGHMDPFGEAVGDCLLEALRLTECVSRYAPNRPFPSSTRTMSTALSMEPSLPTSASQHAQLKTPDKQPIDLKTSREIHDTVYNRVLGVFNKHKLDTVSLRKALWDVLVRLCPFIPMRRSDHADL